jgi:predicted nucleotidyltransferase
MENVSLATTIVFVKETMPALSDLLFPALYRRKALALLLLTPDRGLHMREISRVTGSSPGTMAKELAQLERAGLLVKSRVGNQVHFSANKKHPVYPELSVLLKKTVGLADVLGAAVAPLASRIAAAFVFGSIARGTEHAASDVDVMIIGEITFAEALDALYPAQDVLQREINPKVFNRQEWRETLRSGSTFLREIIDKPKIFVIGSQHDLDLLGEPSQDRPA